MNREQVVAMIREQFPDAQLRLTDLTGTEDHYELQIASGLFTGLTQIKRHRLVYRALGDHVGREIHALALTTYLPEEWPPQPDESRGAVTQDSSSTRG